MLQRRPCRIRDAGVVVALVLADSVLHIRRREIDRRRNRAGRGVRLLALMDGASLEVHYVSMLPAPMEVARLRSGFCRATGFTPASQCTEFTFSTPVLRSSTGSILPISRSP